MQPSKLDFKKRAEDLINLLGKTSVNIINKEVATEFIECELREIAKKIQELPLFDIIGKKVGDTFKLSIDKPKCTLGNEYKIFRKVEQESGEIEYWFYNDEGKVSIIYEDDALNSLMKT